MMKKYPKQVMAFSFLLALMGCLENNEKFQKVDDEGWIKETKVSKLIGNVNFVFPERGYAFDNKEGLIKRTLEAIDHNKKILRKKEFKNTIYVRVMSSRDEMFIYTGTRASGNAYPYWSTLNIVFNEDEVNPPVEHELMHLMVMLDWDYPRSSSNWINEGIATYAANNCNGYSVAEIYRYLLAESYLIPIEDLFSDFYSEPEMVAYHQSGYIVHYLLENYGLEKFKQLWVTGFESFEGIYGFSYSKMESDLQKTSIREYPEAPKIDWEKFKKGCK